MTIQTAFDFALPRGYADGSGAVHKNGRMRLATALDEVEIMGDPRVQANEAYVPILLLSRVVVSLGGVTAVTPQTIGDLFASDLVYLEDLYLRLNSADTLLVGAVCPHCSRQFQLQVAPLAA